MHSRTSSLDTVNIAEVLRGTFLTWVLFSACRTIAINENLKPTALTEQECSHGDLIPLNSKLFRSLTKEELTCNLE